MSVHLSPRNLFPSFFSPRLAQRSSSSNRYQNQRHPSNRPPTKIATEHNSIYSHSSVLSGGGMLMGQQQPQQGQQPIQGKREPLLPTPNEMIKLDTGITGVWVCPMEAVAVQTLTIFSCFCSGGTSQCHGGSEPTS